MPLDDTIHDSDVKSLLPETRVSRRIFVAGAAVTTGLALAVRPARAAAIKTDMAGLKGGMVTVPTPDGNIPAYMAMPATGTNHPVILVAQEIFSVHEHIKDVCRRLGKMGHLAIAPELYHRQGDPSRYTFKEIRKLIAELVAKVPDRQVMSDLDAAAKFAGRNGGDVDKLAITGFCWGGRIVWMYAAHNPALKAGVAWYGRIVARGRNPNTPAYPIDVAHKIKSPVLGLYGGRIGAYRSRRSGTWNRRSKRPATTRSRSSFIRTRRTGFTPTTVRAIAKLPPGTVGNASRSG